MKDRTTEIETEKTDRKKRNGRSGGRTAEGHKELINERKKEPRKKHRNK